MARNKKGFNISRTTKIRYQSPSKSWSIKVPPRKPDRLDYCSQKIYPSPDNGVLSNLARKIPNADVFAYYKSAYNRWMKALARYPDYAGNSSDGDNTYRDYYFKSCKSVTGAWKVSYLEGLRDFGIDTDSGANNDNSTSLTFFPGDTTGISTTIECDGTVSIVDGTGQSITTNGTIQVIKHPELILCENGQCEQGLYYLPAGEISDSSYQQLGYISYPQSENSDTDGMTYQVFGANIFYALEVEVDNEVVACSNNCAVSTPYAAASPYGLIKWGRGKSMFTANTPISFTVEQVPLEGYKHQWQLSSETCTEDTEFKTVEPVENYTLTGSDGTLIEALPDTEYCTGSNSSTLFWSSGSQSTINTPISYSIISTGGDIQLCGLTASSCVENNQYGNPGFTKTLTYQFPGQSSFDVSTNEDWISYSLSTETIYGTIDGALYKVQIHFAHTIRYLYRIPGTLNSVCTSFDRNEYANYLAHGPISIGDPYPAGGGFNGCINAILYGTDFAHNGLRGIEYNCNITRDLPPGTIGIRWSAGEINNGIATIPGAYTQTISIERCPGDGVPTTDPQVLVLTISDPSGVIHTAQGDLNNLNLPTISILEGGSETLYSLSVADSTGTIFTQEYETEPTNFQIACGGDGWLLNFQPQNISFTFGAGCKPINIVTNIPDENVDCCAYQTPQNNGTGIFDTTGVHNPPAVDCRADPFTQGSPPSVCYPAGSQYLGYGEFDGTVTTFYRYPETAEIVDAPCAQQAYRINIFDATGLIKQDTVCGDPTNRVKISGADGLLYRLWVSANGVTYPPVEYSNYDPTSNPDLFYIKQLEYLEVILEDGTNYYYPPEYDINYKCTNRYSGNNGPFTVDYYYDQTLGRWVVNIIDGDGNIVGTEYYDKEPTINDTSQQPNINTLNQDPYLTCTCPDHDRKIYYYDPDIQEEGFIRDWSSAGGAGAPNILGTRCCKHVFSVLNQLGVSDKYVPEDFPTDPVPEKWLGEALIGDDAIKSLKPKDINGSK